MPGPFKMKGYSYPGTSPIQQNTGKRLVTKSTPRKEKFRLSVGTLADGTKEYFKIDSQGTKTKISETEYNSMKGQ